MSEYSMSKFSSLEDPDKNCQRWVDGMGGCWLQTHSRRVKQLSLELCVDCNCQRYPKPERKVFGVGLKSG
jgi:hypothetical protein